MKTYSILIAWNDNDDEEGDYGATVRATDRDEAEAKVRALMAADDQFSEPARCIQCGCTDNDGSDICPDCGGAIEDVEPREYGRLLDCTEGAMWKAADLEAALRDMRATYGRLHDFLSDAIEGGRMKESDLPDDYQAIVAQLEACTAADHKAKAIIAEIDLELDR